MSKQLANTHLTTGHSNTSMFKAIGQARRYSGQKLYRIYPHNPLPLPPPPHTAPLPFDPKLSSLSSQIQHTRAPEYGVGSLVASWRGLSELIGAVESLVNWLAWLLLYVPTQWYSPAFCEGEVADTSSRKKLILTFMSGHLLSDMYHAHTQ